MKLSRQSKALQHMCWLWTGEGGSSDRGYRVIATGSDGLFIETHPNPAVAKSDGANMLRLDLLQGLLEQLVKIRKVVTEF